MINSRILTVEAMLGVGAPDKLLPHRPGFEKSFEGIIGKYTNANQAILGNNKKAEPKAEQEQNSSLKPGY